MEVEANFVHCWAERKYNAAFGYLVVAELKHLMQGAPNPRNESDAGLATCFVVKRLQQCFVEQVSKLSKDPKRFLGQIDDFANFWSEIEGDLPLMDGACVRDPVMSLATHCLADQVHATMVLAEAVRPKKRMEVWPSVVRKMQDVIISSASATTFSKAFQSYAGGRLFLDKVRQALAKTLGDEKFHTCVGEAEKQTDQADKSVKNEEGLLTSMKLGNNLLVKLTEGLSRCSPMVYEEAEEKLVRIVKFVMDKCLSSQYFISGCMANDFQSAMARVSQEFETGAVKKVALAVQGMLPLVRTLRGCVRRWVLPSSAPARVRM